MIYTNFPLHSPFKFVPDTDTYGIHFDDAWFHRQIKSFEKQVRYLQKVQRSDETTLQIESSVEPDTLKLIGLDGQVKFTFGWGIVHQDVNFNIYHNVISFKTIPEGIYFLTQRIALGNNLEWKVISEPIHVKEYWPNTLYFTYKNSYNDWGVAWTAGIKYTFRCEAGIMDFEPGRDRAATVTQSRIVKTLGGIPWRVFKLYIGDAKGVAPWVVDLLNRIFLCDYIDISGKLFQSDADAKWEVTRIKGMPTIGASIDIVEAFNNASLGFAQDDAFNNITGIVAAYNIDTSVFGAGTLVPIIDVEKQG